MGRNIYVLSIDGMPYTLLKHFMETKTMKNFGQLMKEHSLKELKSVIPVISSVAWTSYATGVNPGEHGIFGFVDREADPFQLAIPLSYDRKAPALWNKLSDAGKKVCVINLPITYPVEKVNGVMISCFLCTDIKKAAYPKEVNQILIDRKYVIDADASLVNKSKKLFLDELSDALERRFEVAHLMRKRNEWNYFHLHIMETDRLMHFFWDDIMDDTSPYHSQILEFFRKLDMLIIDFTNQIDKQDSILFLSDHGFCKIKFEVQINRWLMEKGYLKLEEPQDLSSYSQDSVCYSLLPGRIYLNLKGREENGSVEEDRYDEIRKKLKHELLSLVCPQTGEQVIEKIYYREELYHGRYAHDAADLIAFPRDGYDLKGSITEQEIFTRSNLNGMHTMDNAFLGSIHFPVDSISNITEISKEILQQLVEERLLYETADHR